MQTRFLPAIAIAALLAGCSGLPNEGPTAIAITAEDIENLPAQEYVVADIDANVANIAGQHRTDDFSRYFSVGSGVRGQIIGVGDGLKINIWEAGENGLFSTAHGKQTTVESVVDENGMIFIPFAGRVSAHGRSIESLRREIEGRLVDKAIQPQVQVVFAQNSSNSAVIVGDIAKSGKYPIPVNGIRVLDLIATAGGSKNPTYETVVTLKRRNRSATTVLENLIDFPDNNIYLAANDNILLAHAPRSFTIFGAVKSTKDYKFDSRAITIAEALAKAGGLDDARADAGGVFLFRFEDLEIARQLSDKVEEKGVAGYKVPVVYRLNFRDPKAFFFARYFEMRDKDVMYVANHPTAEFGKFLKIIQPAITGARSIDTIAQP